MKSYMIFAIAFLITIMGATALPVTIDEVQIDGIKLEQNAVNKLSLERGQEYEVKVIMTAQAEMSTVVIKATITGYEYSDTNEIYDASKLFDTKPNVTYYKNLNIIVPDDVEQDDYKLRIYVSDKNNEESIAYYNLKIDVPRNSLNIQDVIFNPSDAIRSGSALLTTVRIENKGDHDQNDVRATISIPALGLSATEYIEEIGTNDEEETEEIFLRIPTCAKPGTYDANIEVEYSQKHYKTSTKKTINVLQDETCNEQKLPTTIILNTQAQTIQPEQTAVYPITITNTEKTSKTFTVTINNNDWATTTIAPTSTAVIPAGQTQTIFINVQPNKNTPAGAHSITATITSGTEIKELTITATIQKANTTKNILESVIIGLLVILVIVGIILAITHFRGKEPETYY